MIDVDGQPVGRVGMQRQLDPVVGVLRMDAADFDAPGSTGCFEVGAVEVDKKLVGVGYGRRDGATEASFSNHANNSCKSSTSVMCVNYGPIL